MPAKGCHGRAECFGTPARFAFSLLLQLSLAWLLRIHFDGENRAAAANVFRSEVEGTGSVSPVAESASSVTADLWHRSHEVVLTSREALQENNIPLDKDTLLLPSNRVRLPDVTRSVNLQEFAGHSSELPHMHALVVLPAKSPEQMLVDGRCRHGNLYIRVRPIEEADDVVELEVDDAFVPSGGGTRLQLPVDSVIIKDGVLDTRSDALLLCSEVGESPVLITLFSLTTSSMPRFSPEPFSLLFQPRQIDIFRSASPNSAILQIKGAVEGGWPTSSRDGGGGHTEVVNYLARVDDPTQIQILQFVHSITRSARCHLERRTLRGPVIFSCEDRNNTLQDITPRTRVPTARKKLASNSLSRTGTSSTESAVNRIFVGAGVLGAMLLVMLRGAEAARDLERYTGEHVASDFKKGFIGAAERVGYGGGNLRFALDAARPSNLRSTWNHLDDADSTDSQRMYAALAFLSGTSLYGALAAAGYTGYKVAELMSALRRKRNTLTPRGRFSNTSRVAALTSVTKSAAFREESDKTVIYAVVP